jgi:hypothetical protein
VTSPQIPSIASSLSGVPINRSMPFHATPSISLHPILLIPSHPSIPPNATACCFLTLIPHPSSLLPPPSSLIPAPQSKVQGPGTGDRGSGVLVLKQWVFGDLDQACWRVTRISEQSSRKLQAQKGRIRYPTQARVGRNFDDAPAAIDPEIAELRWHFLRASTPGPWSTVHGR